ncbi:hypothetical protein LCGC14_1343110 [marine sediment metagenome]|uniref:Uncharacterized protein n=1 Tax=marine sediment metagenome TaxID=412755 RepID=A0A0F9KDR3_9ZZZZ
MAAKLYNVVEFVAVPPGGVAVLPHGLNIAGRGVVPDMVHRSDDAFAIVTVNVANVTVRNMGSIAAHCDVLLASWHTESCEFGAFVSATIVGGAPAMQFVMRQGGVAGANVYTDWMALIAAVSAVQGGKLILVDDSAVAPIRHSFRILGRDVAEVVPPVVVVKDVVTEVVVEDVGVVEAPSEVQEPEDPEWDIRDSVAVPVQDGFQFLPETPDLVDEVYDDEDVDDPVDVDDVDATDAAEDSEAVPVQNGFRFLAKIPDQVVADSVDDDVESTAAPVENGFQFLAVPDPVVVVDDVEDPIDDSIVEVDDDVDDDVDDSASVQNGFRFLIQDPVPIVDDDVVDTDVDEVGEDVVDDDDEDFEVASVMSAFPGGDSN